MKNSKKENLKAKEFISAHSSRVQSIMDRESRPISVLGHEAEMNAHIFVFSLPFPLFCTPKILCLGNGTTHSWWIVPPQ